MGADRRIGGHRGRVAARTILVGARAQDGDVVWVLVDTGKPTATVESIPGTDLVTDAGILRLDEYCATDSEVLTGIDPIAHGASRSGSPPA